MTLFILALLESA